MPETTYVEAGLIPVELCTSGLRALLQSGQEAYFPERFAQFLDALPGPYQRQPRRSISQSRKVLTNVPQESMYQYALHYNEAFYRKIMRQGKFSDDAWEAQEREFRRDILNSAVMLQFGPPADGFLIREVLEKVIEYFCFVTVASHDPRSVLTPYLFEFDEGKKIRAYTPEILDRMHGGGSDALWMPIPYYLPPREDLQERWRAGSLFQRERMSLEKA